MVTSAYANNLAKALFEDALKQNALIKWLSELRMVSDLTKDHSVMAFLQKAGMGFAEKSKLLKERVGPVDPQVMNLVGMLSDKGKLGELESISFEYQRMVDTRQGIEGAEVAEITTALPMDDEDKLKMGKRLSEILGKPVTLKIVVAPELLGGVVIRVGDKLIDGSVRHRLQTLSKELM
jgi:F-type H+-transporting ATPase subunit delta